MFDNEIKIFGKHATYLKFISKQTKKNNRDAKIAPIFNRNIDVYMAAAIIGAVKNRRAPLDSGPGADSTSIFAGQVIANEPQLKLLYRMILITDMSSNKTEEERIDFVFRSTENEEIAKGLAIFNSYVRGGIEWLYEKITEDATSEEQYIENLYNLVEEFNEMYYESNNVSPDDLFN